MEQIISTLKAFIANKLLGNLKAEAEATLHQAIDKGYELAQKEAAKLGVPSLVADSLLKVFVSGLHEAIDPIDGEDDYAA